MIVERTHPSGLVLAEQSADEASITAALKRIDRRLVLQKHPGDVAGGFVYKVFQIVSEDQPAVCVLTWADGYGNPLPLSSGLVDETQKWLPENRARRGLSADERNEQLRAQVERDRQAQQDAIDQDHAAKLDRRQVSVSLAQMGRKPYWMRNSQALRDLLKR